MKIREYIRNIILESIKEEWIVFDAKFKYSTYKEVLFIGTKEEVESVIINNPEMNLEMSIRQNPTIVGIDEDITASNGEVKFSYNQPEKAKNINTSLGKSSKNIKFNPRISTLKNSRVKVVSAYSKNTGGDVTDILKSIKKTKDSKYKLAQDDYSKFINRTAIFFVRYLKKQKHRFYFCNGIFF